MIITLNKKALETIGFRPLKPFGYTEDQVKHKFSFQIDLSDLTKAKTLEFRKMLENFKNGEGGIASRIKDVDSWLGVLEGKTPRIRKMTEFAPLLKQYLKGAPKHWIYERRENGNVVVWQPYYVRNIHYHPPVRRDGYTIPDYVTVDLVWEEMGEVHKHTDTYHIQEVVDLTAPVALAEAGYLTENDERLATYLELLKKYNAIWNKVGLQFEAVGLGSSDVDTSDRTSREESWWSRATSSVRLDRDGIPGRVVIDVLNESGKEESSARGKSNAVSSEFWLTEACDLEGKEDDDDDVIKPGDEDEDQERVPETADIPICPAVPVFDLKRHKRFRVYVEQLTQYVYDTSMSEKLILPDDVRNLVNLLVNHSGGFKDIVGSKGQGAIILCAGKPGTGKTLTSEVYSEAMQRPLYSVQCSQLGTDPDELENNLLKIFARAQRWNSILLLDECDVYVATRGNNLEQNAIVGVFLRVLEYYQGVMFMTTNRADLVDDAILSRCLARLTYKIPTPDDQKRIWRTLSQTADIPIRTKEIDKIVAKYPALSGRDVKNLLKLANTVALARNTEVDAEIVGYVKQFKPTSDLDEKS